MQKPKYKIPKNLCQVCYDVSGRFILDCYCIICQDCYSRLPPKGSTCNLCGKATKGNKIDAKQQSSIKKIGHLFQNVDSSIQKLLQVYKFQNEITNRYCQHLQRELTQYQSAVNDLIAINPNLNSYFGSRVRLKRNSNNGQTQQIERNHSYSIKGDPTVKPNREYASQVYDSRRSTLELNPPNQKNHQNMEMNGIRVIGKNQHNHSGNIVYKVPNINYNTAVRSSQRVSRDQNQNKIPPQYDQDFDYYKRRPQQR